MTTRRTAICALLPVLLLTASAAFAQSTTGPGADDTQARSENASTGATAPARTPAPFSLAMLRHFYVSANGGYQDTTNTFATSWTMPYYLETASLNANYSAKPGILIDVGGGVRVWRDLTLGVAVSRYHRADAASVSATLPNPLLFDQPRTFAGTTAGPSRTETAAHVQAMWTLAVRPKILVGIFGGPSYFSISQVTISDVNFDEVYPFVTVSIGSVSTGSRHGSKIGFNAGTDLTVLVYKQVGAGVFVRYSAVTIGGFTGPDGAPLSLKAGGVQAGAGIRVRF